MNFDPKKKSVSVNVRLIRRAFPVQDDDVPPALILVGLMTVALAVAAASSGGPEGALAHHQGIALAGAFLGGVATLLVAVWVSSDTPRRAGLGRLILCFSWVAFVVALVVSGFDFNITDLF